ncbi:cytochrome P450 [Nocardia sp. NPDC004068]|uniref:cytochrome P450 family protein n=1 Tax=Nocardia sp. NPDC004068 TaxID=3364303 RepID=UPI00368CEB5C
MVETLSADFFTDPHVHYRRWREHGPVHRIRFPDGVERWIIVGYPEARAALADPRLRKDIVHVDGLVRAKRPAAAASPLSLTLLTHMLNTDPPQHARLRKLVNKAFAPRRVAALRPRIERITDELLDALDTGDRVDLLRGFAVPLPITVICEVLGVAVDDRDAFRTWTTDLVGVVGREAERARATAAMAAFLRDLVQAKRSHPGDDLLSALTLPAEDGDRLTENELVSMAFLLLIAGHETTVNLIGNGALALLRDPDRLRELSADLSAVPDAVESFLRYDGPVDLATIRYTAEPVRIGDTEIPTGELVYVSLAAANRDPDRFPHPDRLDLSADASGHLAFGHGIHFCAGAPLARLEASIAFTALLKRFPDLRLDIDAADLRWYESTLIRGLIELPVRLRP